MIFILEAFFSGCISKVINDGKDYSWFRIKNVIKDRHDQNISTKIYRLIERALNTVTDNTYKNSDDLYDAIEKIFNEFKNHGDTLESVKSGLDVLGADGSDQRCENFLEEFYQGIRLDDDLYKAIMMDLEQEDIKISQEGFQKVNEKIDNLTQIVSRENDNKIDLPKREPVKSRTKEYADKWNQNMFLNDFDKRDENAGVNVKLSEVYLEEHLPHYIWGSGKNARDDLKDLLQEYIYLHNDNKMLVILGQPGIGKSTLITWITAKFSKKIDDILVYRFAADLEDIDWQSSRVSNRILEKLNFEYKDLNGKTLILDGLDEVSINNRRDVLECLYGDWIYGQHEEKFSLIITCRENYVQEIDRVKSTYITLQPCDKVQINSFCNVFQEKTGDDISESTMEKIFENRVVLGIPLILYMILALNISIEKEGSIVDVYDKIFSLEGGIYDRCIDNKSFAERHRIGEIKTQIHQISREVAFWMFENKPDEAYIPQEEYETICANIMQASEWKNDDAQSDFLIGNYFKLVKYCEGIETEELYFVHRSIYEYFVAETIFSSINESVDQSKESLAGVFGKLFKRGNLSPIIVEYLKHKIIKSKLRDAFESVNDTFQLMLQDGMTYYTNKSYRNVLDCEMKVFKNMLEIMHLWERDCYRFENEIIYFIKIYIIMNINEILNCNEADFSNVDFSEMDLTYVYLKNAILNEANLNGVNLSLTDLSGISLVGASLIGTCLTRSHLLNANLRMANLTNADLGMANLTGADLTDIDLTGADLTGACFDEKQVRYLKTNYNLQDTRVLIEETGDVLSFKEYCKGNH